MMRVKLRQSAPDAYINRAIDGIVDVANHHGRWLIANGYATLLKEFPLHTLLAEDYCGNKRPTRKILCQLRKNHKGSHRAVIFWE